MYTPLIFEVPKEKEDILKAKSDVQKNSFLPMPKFSLGFHSFIHQTKDKMSILDKIKKKKNFYYVVNKFEHIILNYEDDLNKLTKIYFNIQEETPNILSRAFYKLWEILFLFDIADSDKSITYAALAEGPGSFLQATMYFREKFFNKASKNDKYFGVSIHSEEKGVKDIAEQFIGFHNKENPGKVNVHKTFGKKESSKSKTKDNGDLTEFKTISLFKKDIKKTKKWADIVTADGGFEWNDENFQEQEAYPLIFGEIVAALNVQAKNGSFVLKLFESFTDITLKMIYITSSFYESSYIYKPFTSRPSNSEKYLVCMGFKYDQDKDKKILKEKLDKLEEILGEFKGKTYMTDIFSEFTLPSNYLDFFTKVDTTISNIQQIEINRIVDYIKGNNYYGEKYHNYRDEQIKATKFWTETFYPINKSLYEKNKKDMDKVLQDTMKNNVKAVKELQSVLS
ncbi:FtsJ-like methyltransferase [seawater metagenome]|uniref:FtsJ-like methyltransferase n=1 Tax=seawater metagenome TaxID=1561972 RepID=A0A5E8CJ55_9ZZZZ